MSEAPAGVRAVFLDRDGVVNEVVFRNGKVASPRSIEEFVFVPGVEDAVARLRAAGFLIFLCTNQPDVARGLMSAEVLEAMHDQVRARIELDGLSACTHDNHHQCHCRKPKPGMLTDFAASHGVDLARSYFVGDSHKDMDAGRAAGVVTVLLRREYNENTNGDIEVKDLDAAVTRIIEDTPS